ncbi:hypothetical protein L211DRAFT_848714 [Terfezia boudieri ATCC MYA-4762]|uniref:Uncharacterized protein n=1 Tax=Terfezia boudieri ATCC MYA-4762 TaxID=1051890 RepID=A0A3N4LPQ6_9PEZI|nr:hypothetical protein L211DRAFT_848714 [Terfezia boudieri ATCC MYA-4762]
MEEDEDTSQSEESTDRIQLVEEGSTEGKTQELRELRPGGDDMLYLTLSDLNITDEPIVDKREDNDVDTLGGSEEVNVSGIMEEADDDNRECIPVISMISDRIMGYVREALREWKIRKMEQALATNMEHKRKEPTTENEESGIMGLEGLYKSHAFEDTHVKRIQDRKHRPRNKIYDSIPTITKGARYTRSMPTSA